MSFGLNINPSRCIDYYCIQSDQSATGMGPDKNLFVGQNNHTEITIENGLTIQFKDIVVLGKLSIQSKNLENTVEKGRVIAENFITAGGDTTGTNVSITVKMKHVCGRQEFEKELEGILLDWFAIQKETADKIGLKSVLI